MKIFIVANPYAFIGYYIVIAQSPEEAQNIAQRRAFNDFPVVVARNIELSDVQEIVFDGDHIFDELRVIE